MISTSDPSTRFVPEGTGPKVYCVICENASDWKEIDSYIINENELDGIPNRAIGCVNPYKTINRMASYEMSDAEAEQLRNHPKVVGVEHDRIYYQGTYDDSDITMDRKTSRYGSNVKISRGVYNASTSAWLSRTSGNIWRANNLIDPWNGLGDGSFPFSGDESMILEGNPEYHGDGTGVDIIVRDECAWFGHTEFVKTGVGEPTNFVGENVLKSGFAASATTGKCGALDIILHAPYYIDPDWFEADSSNRLELRWDGTTVPKRTAAVLWWGTERCTTNITVKLTDSSNAANFKLFTMSTGSVNFSTFTTQYSVSLTSSGGTLSNGEVTVEVTETINGTLELQQSDNSWVQGPWSYTYDLVSSTNTPSSEEISIFGASGNDLYINRYDKSGTDNWGIFLGLITYGSTASTDARSAKYVGVLQGGTAATGSSEDFGTFTVGANYTEAKCNGSNTAFQTGEQSGTGAQRNSDHGTPCMSQAYGKTFGWAFNANKWFIALGYGLPNITTYLQILKVFHQLKPNNPLHGTKDPTVVSQSYSKYKEISNGWYAYFRGGTPEVIVKSGSGNATSPKWVSKYYKSGHVQFSEGRYTTDHVAGAALVDAGVIMVNSGGNNNQKLVMDDHPDYDNYIGQTNTKTLANAVNASGAYTANRITFPGSSTVVTNYNGTGKEVHRSFQIGALDDQKKSSTQERKANYSNMGEVIDCWTQTHGWGANDNQGTSEADGGVVRYSRYDSTYTIGGVTSLESKDERFTGTSSACPVAAGLLSTKLGLHRDWTWVELKDWLKTRVTEQTTDAMYQGTEATTADDSNWAAPSLGWNLQGGNRRILWDADSTPMPSDALLYIGQCDGLTVSGNGLTILNI